MKRLSISRNLTVSILITVMVVSGIGIFVSYYIATQRTSAELNEKADEYLAFIVNTVGEPLWYLNDRHLNVIVSYFDKNEHIAGLRITDSGGKEIFHIAKEDVVPAITRESDLYYDNNRVGRVTLSLTSRSYEEINRQFLWSSVVIVLSILLILIITIGLLLRRFLRRPLNDLTEIARAYGSGDYNRPVQEDVVDEFKTIVSVFQKMGGEIRDQMSELKEKERLAAIGELSGNISHEMKNSLGVIDSSVYYLKMRLKSEDAKVQTHLERIKSAVITSDGIIKSLADLTRTTALNLERFNLIDIMAGSIKTADPPETVKVIETYAKEEIEIDGDPEALGMAFRNIIDNAIRSMDGKGRISVAVKRFDEHAVAISFADTGPGISRENLGKIFQPLFTTRAKGMGFGLSMTKMIVEKHHGAIQVKSEEGKGATFTVRLPIIRTEPEEARPGTIPKNPR
jgi:signal transduction histidine kinase